ncbi:MAG: Zn-dependent oligopeptidase [Novosphingobium sp.]|nr:Zn-dependent oligopeptidase [Novosphingobium sp.]
MRKSWFGFGLPLCLACIGAAPAPADDADAFLAGYSVTPANAAEVDARCKSADALARRLFAALAARKGPASVAGDLQRFDSLANLLSDTGNQMSFLSQASPDKAIRDAGQKCSEQLSGIITDLSLSRPVYDRLAAIPRSGLDAATAFTLDKQLLDYRLAGVDKDAATRTRVATLNKEITSIGLEFDRNISEDKSEVTFDSIAALDGLPQDYLDAHKPGPDGRVHVSMAYPDLFPALRFANSPATRRTLYIAFMNRAYPANEPVLAKLIARRQELAQTLGYPDFATYVTSNKMVGSPGRVLAFLDEVKGAALAAGKADQDRLLARAKQIDPATTALNPWDWSYLANLVRKEQFDVDNALVRQYFTRDKAQAGIFALVHDLFGSTVRPWKTKVWAPDVTAWELYDGDTLVGRFYLDLSPREGKFSHAAQFGIQTGVDGKRVPVGALLCNFPATGPMDHGDVETFLHEFGHLIHSLYSGHQRYSLQSMDQLQWDFIEAPSQFLEEWVWDYDTLRTFASNDRGEPIPAALVAKMNAARHFGESASWLQQLGFSSVSLGYYSRPAGFDLKTAYNELYGRYSLIPEPAESHMYASFDHLNGYSAIYYTYAWSKGIALDLFTRFKAAGMHDRATAMAYRHAVLEPGGSKPADQLIRDFLGRDLSTQALRDELAASAEPGK